MKTITIVMATLLAVTSVAQADGFKCTGLSTGTVIKLYNHTDPSQGTRNAAIMIVSDSSEDAGSRTIATFKDVSNLLNAQGYGQYSAKVDLRFSGSNNTNKAVAGTTLGNLATIGLVVDFDYAHTSQANTAMEETGSIAGVISYNKRDGEVLKEAANCVRYLKN